MKLEKELKSRLNYLFDIFERNNILEVQINFYGSGDDGNMEVGHALLNPPPGPPSEFKFADDVIWDEPTIFNDPRYPPSENVLINLGDLVREVSNDLLDKKGIDYVNGNGNEGSITYTVKGKDVSMAYLVTEDAEYNFSV
jgi:hypothetical protein